MNNDHIKGGFNEAKGKVKEEFGAATGNTKTESSGVADQIGGKIRRGVGDLKDKVKEGVDHLLNRDESDRVRGH